VALLPANVNAAPLAIRAGFAKNTLSRKPIRSPCAPNAEARKRLIDGRLLRTVAANLSASGLKRQNYDLIMIECAEAAGAFKRAFDTLFGSREALVAGAQEWAERVNDFETAGV